MREDVINLPLVKQEINFESIFESNNDFLINQEFLEYNSSFIPFDIKYQFISLFLILMLKLNLIEKLK